jgi:hypothetical protein
MDDAEAWFAYLLQRPDHPVWSAVAAYARVHYPDLYDRYATARARAVADASGGSLRWAA